MSGPNINDEILMAFVDKELSEIETRRVREAIAANPALAERAEMFRRTRVVAKEAFEPLLAEPVPEALRRKVEAAIAARQPASNVVQLKPRRSFAGLAGLPLAASVAALAVGIGGYLIGSGLNSGIENDRIVLGGVPVEIATALATKPSGERTATGLGQLNLIASFKTEDGRLCREFEVDPPKSDTIVGVACRASDADWRVVFAVAAPPADNGYAPASSAQALESYLTATGAGPALSPEEERAALGR